MVEAKHEFIDDNPYLVYSPDAEATTSGSGGAGFPIVEINTETRAINATAGELKEMLTNGMVLIKPRESGAGIWSFITGYRNAQNTIVFPVLSADGTEVKTFSFIATSDNDYPTLGN